MQRMYTSSAHSIEQEECESSRLCVCRLCKHYYARCHDQSHSMHCSYSSTGLWSRCIGILQGWEWHDPPPQHNLVDSKGLSTDSYSQERIAMCSMPSQNERHKQMVICPEQDCEWLVYMSELDTCMVEALHGCPGSSIVALRVQEFKEWQKKNNKSSKSSKEAWTWEGSSSSKWSTTSTRGSSKRGQSVPVDLSKRTNPEEKSLARRELDELDTSLEFLFPETSLPCPVEKSIPLPPEKKAEYIHWIARSFKLDHRVDKDPRLYCAYCDVNNHPRFTCKHVEKHT